MIWSLYLGPENGFVTTIRATDVEGRRRRGDTHADLVIDDGCVENEILDVGERGRCYLGVGYWNLVDPIYYRGRCRLSLKVESCDYTNAVFVSTKARRYREDAYLSAAPLRAY